MSIDWSKAARRPLERRAIVEWILQEATDSAESDYLEWKTGYDLTGVPGRLATARQVIGLANRHPDRAARHVEGCGYLLLGVEPGNLVGMPEHDPADLENWLTPYLGPHIAWDPSYVSLDGKHVLFVTVEAPRWGDEIHCLRQSAADRDGRTVREGTVWIRKLGKTEQATASDMDMLAARTRAGARTLSLDVVARESSLPTITAEVLSDKWRDEVLAHQKSQLLRDVPASDGVFPFLAGEFRKPSAFEHDVLSYLDDARRRWKSLVAAGFVEEGGCLLTLEVVNESDLVFESVQVEACFPFHPGWVFSSAAAARDRFNPPERPAPWGSALSLAPKLPMTGIGAGTEIEEQPNEVLVRYAPILVRPRTTHALSELRLALPPGLAGQDVPVTWRATSSSTTGEIAGILTLVLAADPSAPSGPAGAIPAESGD